MMRDTFKNLKPIVYQVSLRMEEVVIIAIITVELQDLIDKKNS